MSAPVVVLKFGGTSLGSDARVRRAAWRVAAHHALGRGVVAVVSARGRTTDRLLKSADRLVGRGGAPEGLSRELDRLLSTGEDRAGALLAMAVERLGVPARSLRGGEAGVLAEGPHGAGEILDVDVAALDPLVRTRVVPVVSGFQGQRRDGETVTLGRGGSDTTAVALAAALGAECHIVTDVTAVCDQDPRLVPGARPHAVLDHDRLVALAEGGARVVHLDAARLAAQRGVTLRIYHFGATLDGEGTRVLARAAAGRPR